MKIGIIGGSGLEKSDILENLEELEIETPYGKPSSKIKKATINNTEVFILSRHGENHEITPTKVNNKANIYALSKLGCEQILSTTAVGSLRENIEPGNFVIINQFIDFTKHRDITFFDDFKKGINHISLAEPFSQKLRSYLIDSCEELDLKHHKIGTVLTIEGPRFSTRAESFMFRKFAHVVNMSTSPEAILAREAGIEYAVIAMATDYDCWKITEDPVSWEEIKKVMDKNSNNVKKLLVRTIEKITNQETTNTDLDYIKSKIRTIPDFPKPGIMFRDITTLFQDPQAMKKTIEILHKRYKDKKIDYVAGIEARGFIIGGSLAEKLNCGFIPIRKKGKLPYEVEQQEYELEYGTDIVEIHKDALNPGQKILIVDDLIATAGTSLATCELVKKIGGEIIETAFIIELNDLQGRKKLENKGYKVFSMINFEESG